ncbi:tRNA (guanine(37)-N1)-methyltransferase [Halyomorpha halys]|uniref:tRNA (guanine(37)-N1)-methyltransferase n=1 Tax=Halyomorpha halys TaxID=286706 RepID=UPI0034D2A387
MKILDKEKFKQTITVPCLYLPYKSIQSASKLLKRYILKLQNFLPITVVSKSVLDKLVKNDLLFEEESKIAILDPRKVNKFSDLEDDCLRLENLGINEKFLFYTDINLGYDNWKADEILRSVIPPEFDAVSGYSLVGHIVHLNLREHLSDYKNLIGSVLLDKIKCARSVVNKIDTIDNTYRNFNMEVLCGDYEMVTQVKENRCIFKFDFSKVYWNPRLSTEHERISEFLKKGDIFYDVFAGVGPFSIPAAKRGCITLANDLNPDSVKWLQTNILLNKLKDNISVFNKDGHEFIKKEVKLHLLSLQPGNYSIHIAMNLPGHATAFLPSFKNLFSEKEMQHIKLLPIPKVYVYTFSKGVSNPSEIALKAVEDAFGQKLETEILDVFFVRDVAPNKKMMRVTLLLTDNILCNRKRDAETEREGKKLCV